MPTVAPYIQLANRRDGAKHAAGPGCAKATNADAFTPRWLTVDEVAALCVLKGSLVHPSTTPATAADGATI